MFTAEIPTYLTGREYQAKADAARVGVELIVLRTKRTFTNQPNLVKTHYLCFDDGANPAVYDSLEAMKADRYGQNWPEEEAFNIEDDEVGVQ